MDVTICCKQFGARGGAETFLRNFARCLVDEGHRVRVLAARVELAMEGLETVPLRVARVPSMLRDLALARAAREALQRESADVTFSDQRCWGAQVVRVGGGLHREYLKQQARTYRNALRGAIFRTRGALSVRNRLRLHIEDVLYGSDVLRCIVTNSEMVREEIARYYPAAASKIRVVYNGVDVERFRPELKEQHRARVREELDIPRDALVGVFVGTGWRRKGLHTFVEALGLLSEQNVCGIVVGKGNRRSMESFARRHGTLERVRFVGSTAPDAYYGASDLLVLPSYYDPCANVTLEGLACGLPALTAATNGAHELLTPGKDGQVLQDAGDAATLAGYIEEFTDQERLMAASRAARELAMEHTLERQYGELMDVLANAAGAD